MNQTLILPIAGRSSRYPGMKPKWLLTHPRGTLMLTESIRGIFPNKFDKIVIIALESHEKDYNFSKPLVEELIKEYNINKDNIKIILLKKETKSQPETVYEGIKKANIEGKIFIKDSDNYFLLKNIPLENSVAVIDLNKTPPIIVGNKSYVQIDSENKNKIVNIIEKKIISNLFCCGGYFFSEATDFCRYFEKMFHIQGLYISHIIHQMLYENHSFNIAESENFEDWGTLEDWLKFKNNFSVVFIDLDGVLVRDSNEHFEPKWGKTEALRRNVAIINKLYGKGKTEIVITTSRKEEYRQTTIEQLKKNSIKYHRLLFGLPSLCKHIVINKFSDENPFPSSIAINTKINDDMLDEFL